MSELIDWKSPKQGIPALAFIVAMVATITYIFKPEPKPYSEELVAFYHGSANVDHDIYYGSYVDGTVYYNLYCSTSGLLRGVSKLGDVVISGRANSYRCAAIDDQVDATVIAGWGNVSEYVDQPVDGAITISHGSPWGAAYGPAIDFMVPAASLSEAMPFAANFIMGLNRARIIAGLPALTMVEMKTLLVASSDGEYVRDGRYYGRIINQDRALDYAINGIPLPPEPEPCEDCGWLTGAVYHPLLLEDNDIENPIEEHDLRCHSDRHDIPCAVQFRQDRQHRGDDSYMGWSLDTSRLYGAEH